MPNDHGMRQILEKIKTLPQSQRKMIRGVVPNYKGYDVRVPKTAEVEMTKALAPERAEELGAALGMAATGKWEIQGIPSHATKARIHQVLAQQVGKWTGWATRPLKTTGPPRNGKISWLVEAASAPPTRSLLVHGRDLIYISKHEEPIKMTKKLNPWYRVQPDGPSPSVWANKAPEYMRMDADDDINQEQEKAMEVDSKTQVSEGPTPMEVETANQENEAKSRKRGLPNAERSREESDQPSMENQILTMLKEQAAQKDNMINALLQQIADLTKQVEALREDLAKTQSQVAKSNL